MENLFENYGDQEQAEDIQLAENVEIDVDEEGSRDYSNRRRELSRTKISKQTWSIRELVSKVSKDELDLAPDYQRNIVWDTERQIAFIESLLMEIVVPPLYFVELPGSSPLDPTRYEVVDGKQRLNSIYEFVKSRMTLTEKYLEYFGDIYQGKTFEDLLEEFEEEMERFASQTLDIYVITASSPEFTKYDIFSRLNKGSAPLKVNEIRKAVYHSELIDIIDNFIKCNLELNSENYSKLFSKPKIKRYDDYGVFFKSIAFYINTNEESLIISDYNSRPREMINNVLASFQKQNNVGIYRKISEIPLDQILVKTLELLEYFDDTQNNQYYIECCIKLAVDRPEEFEKIKSRIKESPEIRKTFEKSKATTSKVNERLRLTYSFLGQ